MVAIMGVGLCMLDPSKEASILKKMFAKTSSNIEPAIQPVSVDIQEEPKEVSSADENIINQDQAGGVATSQINNQQGGES
jgi:hypothetical protein